MYPRRQLAALAARKALLQAKIEVRRLECAIAATELARPIGWVDRGIALWRRISPIVKALALPGALSLGWFLRKRKAASPSAAVPKPGKMAAIMAALPVVLEGVKLMQGMMAAKKPRHSAAAHAP
jgi:hypothetical protein